MDLHDKVEGQMLRNVCVWRVSAFVSVRSYQHSGGVVVAVTRMPNTACLGRNSTTVPQL